MTTYRILCKYKDDNRMEEVASNLSYGELSQYLLDCFSNEEPNRFNNIEEIEDKLYKHKYTPLKKSLKLKYWILFNEYKLRIEVEK